MKQNDKQPTIKAGVPVTIEADSREAAAQKLKELGAQAKADGLKAVSGGFIMPNVAEGKFSATITFE